MELPESDMVKSAAISPQACHHTLHTASGTLRHSKFELLSMDGGKRNLSFTFSVSVSLSLCLSVSLFSLFSL